VLGAVAHAHSNLIVHRDIKPSNVLIRKDGQAKLLDFGIAKLLSDESLPALATLLTIEGGGALTPQFAAPEQVTGGPVTTATDVYGLGVLLYVLLTGQHPAGRSSQSPAELLKAIVETEPPRASDSVTGADARSVADSRASTPEKLRRQLRGDLDTILGKALKKNSGERYRSVTAFAEDLQRYVKHEPISARPDSFTYRAGKFIYRHSVGVAVTIFVVLGIIAGITAVEREARRAEYRFRQVRKLAHTVLFDLTPQIEQLPGSTKAREFLVKTSLDYLDSLVQEASNDERLQLELASAYEQIGDVQGNPRYSNLGHPDAAVQSYRKAIAIAHKLPMSADALEILAGTYTKMGVVQAWGLGLRPEAHENLRIATEFADSIPKLGKQDYQLRLQAHGFLGEIDELYDPIRAAQPLRQSLDIAREWVQADPSATAKYFLAILEREWGTILWETGDLNGARKGLLDSNETFAAITRQDPSNKDWAREQIDTYERLGLLSGDSDFFNLGDRKAAANWIQKMLDSCERLRAVDASDIRALSDLSDAVSDLAAVYRRSDPYRAEKLYQRSLSLRRSALESAPHDPEKLYAQSFNEISFATLLRQMGKQADAIKQLQSAIQIANELVKRDSTEISFRQLLGVALHRKAFVLASIGQISEAEHELQQSEDILTPLYQENSNNLLILRDLADCYRVKGDVAARQSKWRDARLAYQRSLDLWNKWPKTGKPSVYDQRQREIAAGLVRKAQSVGN
jgi:eukaryotic-like serine/threonine-protein kinase